MTTRVFHEAWQLQCCGEGFAVGDRVSWTATRAGDLAAWFGQAEAAGIEWCEEHHDGKARTTTVEGEVTRIRTIRQRYREETPGGKLHVPVEGDVVASDTPTADGYVARDPADDSWRFLGYVVTLESCRLLPL